MLIRSLLMSSAESAAKNAAMQAAREQAKIQNYLQSKAALEAMLQNPALSEAEKARIRAEAQTKGLASAFTLAQTAARGLDELDPTSAARQQAYQDYRAGERNAETIVKDYQARQAYQDYRAGEHNAEAIAAEYQTRKAVQDYRQGERGEYVTPAAPSQPKPWWQRAGEWVQQKIVQPVQDFAARWSEPPNARGPLYPKLHTTTTLLQAGSYLLDRALFNGRLTQTALSWHCLMKIWLQTPHRLSSPKTQPS